MGKYGGTDLGRLHAVVAMDNPGRGAGRTFAACHTVAGVLEVTGDSGVVCSVLKYDRIIDIMRKMVFQVFPDHGIFFYKRADHTQFVFFLPGKIKKYVKFVVVDDVEALAGNVWPVVEFTEYKLKEKGADNWKNRVPLM